MGPERGATWVVVIPNSLTQHIRTNSSANEPPDRSGLTHWRTDSIGTCGGWSRPDWSINSQV